MDDDVACARAGPYEAPLTEATHSHIVGTVDVPAKIDRERFFRELSYVELSALFAGPLKPSSLQKWTEAPPQSIGLVAPFPLTHRKPPSGSKLWKHDATSGDFRASEPGRATLAPLREALAAVSARCVVFRSPATFSPSAANRDLLREFFATVVPAELVGVPRVWLPGGLWDVRTAAKLAGELDVTLAFDPLVREPGEPTEIYFDLDVSTLYLRPEGAGRAGTLRNERLEDLAALVEHYEELPTTVCFASPERWQDARNFVKLLEGVTD
jgi:hypothetical protein